MTASSTRTMIQRFLRLLLGHCARAGAPAPRSERRSCGHCRSSSSARGSWASFGASVAPLRHRRRTPTRGSRTWLQQEQNNKQFVEQGLRITTIFAIVSILTIELRAPRRLSTCHVVPSFEWADRLLHRLAGSTRHAARRSSDLTCRPLDRALSCLVLSRQLDRT